MSHALFHPHGLNLDAKLAPFHFSLDCPAGRAQMVLMIFKILGSFILRGALPLAIVVDDQVACKAHQPVAEVALVHDAFGVHGLGTVAVVVAVVEVDNLLALMGQELRMVL